MRSKPEDKDSLLRERGPLQMGFVFALYRATMSPQQRDNAGITTASRRRTEQRPSSSPSLSPSLFLSLLPLSRFLCLLGASRSDVGRKNKRNNGFIISGLQRRVRGAAIVRRLFRPRRAALTKVDSNETNPRLL